MSQYSPGAPVWLSCIVVYMPLAAVDTKCIDIKDAHGCLLISGRSLEDLLGSLQEVFLWSSPFRRRDADYQCGFMLVVALLFAPFE